MALRDEKVNKGQVTGRIIQHGGLAVILLEKGLGILGQEEEISLKMGFEDNQEVS